MTELVVHGNFVIDAFDSASTGWNRWLKRFEGAVTVFKVPATQKVTYLLHFIGATAFDLICDKFASEDPYDKSYTVLTEKLGEFYAPAPLEIAKNYRFHQRKQFEGESVQQFVAALQKLSVYCKFRAYLQTALRNQLVFGLLSKRAQSRLLETKELTFEKAVEIATSMEMSEKDVHQLQSSATNVHYVAHKDLKSSRKPKYTPSKKLPETKAAVATGPRQATHTNTNTNENFNISCYRFRRKTFSY